jgi:hypothetical protein
MSNEDQGTGGEVAAEEILNGEIPMVPTTGKIGVTVGLFLFVLYLTNQGFADLVSAVVHSDLDEVPTRGICVQQQYDEAGTAWYVQVPCWSAATKAEVIEVYMTPPAYDASGWTACDYAGGTLIWLSGGVTLCTVPE